MLTFQRFFLGFVFLGPLTSAGLTGAEEPPLPTKEDTKAPWQRVLQGDDARRAAALGKRITECVAADQFGEAAVSANDLLELRNKVQGEDHWQSRDARERVATLQRVGGRPKEERRDYQRIPDLERQAVADHARNRLREAQRLFEEVLEIRRKLLGEQHPETATSLNNLASCSWAQGKYADALDAVRRVLAVRQKALGESHPDTARSYNQLASALTQLGRLAEAEASFRTALKVLRAVRGEQHADTADGYNNLALCLASQGRYAEAEAAHHKALTVRRAVRGEDHPETAASYNNLASCLSGQGRHAEAEAQARRGLAICRNLSGTNHQLTISVYNALASALDDQRKYDEAEENYREALALCRKVLGDNHPLTGNTYNNLAMTLRALRRYEDAEKAYHEALKVFRAAHGEEHPYTANVHNNLALCLGYQGKYDAAEKAARQALDLYQRALGKEHPLVAGGHGNLSRMLYAQGRYQEAEDEQTRAADLHRKHRVSVALPGLDRASGDRTPAASITLAALLARRGKVEEAWRRLEEGLGRSTWDEMAARLRRSPEDRARATELRTGLERINRLLEVAASGAPSPERERRRKELLDRRGQLQDDLDAFHRRLEKEDGFREGAPHTLAQVQAALPADTALLAWVDLLGDRRADNPEGEHWGMVLRSKGPPVWSRLSGSGPKGAWTGDDDGLALELLAAVSQPPGSRAPDWRDLTRRLKAQRIDPVLKHLAARDGLPAVRHIVVLPSALVDGVPVELLVEGVTVGYASSATLFSHLRALPATKTRGLFALADPVFERPGERKVWQSLPGTRVEVEALQRLFTIVKQPSQMLTDSDASEQKLLELVQGGQLGRVRYLHLATHGELDHRLPLQSAVILSGDALPDSSNQLLEGKPPFDGRLSAAEVLEHWKLDADLVTLSACQSGLGKHERGEGHMGFAQCILLAGSRTVCLSLWKVDDAATALLMERFYQNLLGVRPGLKAPLGKAAALAEAQAWLRALQRDKALKATAAMTKGVARGKGRPAQPLLPEVPPAAEKDAPPYAHPYYWAGFVLVGAPD